MENTQKKIILDQLDSKKKEFERTLYHLIQKQKDFNDQWASERTGDESDTAQREVSTYSTYSLIDRKTKEIKKIERLIQKISSETKDEDFGTCEECGNPISPQRLQIVPDANLCVDCQRRIEQMDKRKTAAMKDSLYVSYKAEEDISDENGGSFKAGDESPVSEWDFYGVPTTDDTLGPPGPEQSEEDSW